MTPRETNERLGLGDTIGRLLCLDILCELAIRECRLVHLEAHLCGGTVGEEGRIGGIELVCASKGVDGFRVFFGRKVLVAL